MPALPISRAARVVAVLAVLAVALAGCSSSSDQDIGSLRISVTTTGTNPDPDGYTLTIEDRSGEAIGVNGTVTIPELPAGIYPVTIAGLAPNCFMEGPGTLTVPVKAGEQATAEFAVSCPASATVRVTTQTTGPDPDADGYLVAIGTSPGRRVGAESAIILSAPEVGQVPIAITDIAAHCTPDPGNPATVNVVAGQRNPITLKVACAAITGSIEVTVTTSGIDQQLDGFRVKVDSETVKVDSANKGAVRMAAGDYSVSLDPNFLQGNCRVTSANPRVVRVVVGAVTRATITVACTPLATVTVSVVTTATGPYPNRFTLRLTTASGESSSFPVASGGPTTLSTVPQGTYRVSLDGIAPNCWVSDASPNPVVVSPGSIALSIAIGCATVHQLAFVSGTGPASEIHSWTGASTSTRLTSNAVADSNPAWSPDGSRLAFASARDGNSDIYVMNADGSDVRRLTSSTAADYQPTWSPDGSRIAFVSQRDDVNGDIYVMAADGAAPVRLTTDPGVDAEPAWSPNGTRILFVSLRSGSQAVHIMNPDGSGVAQLTFPSPSAADASPAWSASGAQVAFVRAGVVHTMNADGSLVASRKTDTYGPTSISWGPDDRIAFTGQVRRWVREGLQVWQTIRALWPNGTVGGVVFLIGSSEPAWRP